MIKDASSATQRRARARELQRAKAAAAFRKVRTAARGLNQVLPAFR